MTTSGRAVFLSYASQDAEAARRICEALRTAGVEVWFDQNDPLDPLGAHGLVGGDAWDAKIRKQIADCALFVPVISAATQARREGYFRLEWRIAAQRTHMMSEQIAFLLPVVIDTTRDADADVPAEFKAVQWTRLPDGEGMEPFCIRVQALLNRPNSTDDAGSGSLSGVPGRRSASTVARPSAPSKASPYPLILLGVGLAALVAVALWWPGKAGRLASGGVSSSTATEHPVAVTPSSTARSIPPSQARELVEKARLLYEPWDLATKDDLVMADGFLKRAIDLDPTDGEVWAHQALVSCAFVAMSVTPEDRRSEMRLQAERAFKFAPNSDTARFARAFAIRLEGKTGAWEEAEPILREVVARNPDNRIMLRGLGYPLAQRSATRAEGLAILQRAAGLPGGDAVAEFLIGQILMRANAAGDLREALAAYNRSLRLAPQGHRTHSMKIELLYRFAGDLAAARQALREVPAAVLREDRVAAVAVRVLLANEEPDEALRILGFTYPYLNTSLLNAPTSYLKGAAHRQANRLSAATTEWNVALKELQRRLDADPTARNELVFKSATLAYLGRAAEAAEALQLYEQLVPPNARADERVLIVKTLLGRIPEVIADADAALHRSRPAPVNMASFILFEPELAKLRADPRYAAIAERARAVYAGVQLK